MKDRFRTDELEMLLLLLTVMQPSGFATTEELIPAGKDYLANVFSIENDKSLSDTVRWALIYMCDERNWLQRPFGKLADGNTYARRDWIRINRPGQNVNQTVWQISDKGKQYLGEISPSKFEEWLLDLPEAINLQNFDATNIQDRRERFVSAIVRRVGQRNFRKTLLLSYDGQCAVSGTSIQEALEAAHIIPYKGIETNHPSNGILLRADIHKLFEKQLIVVDTETMQVRVAPTLRATEYQQFDGQPINLPDEKFFQPDKMALDIHRKAASWLGSKDK